MKKKKLIFIILITAVIPFLIQAGANIYFQVSEMFEPAPALRPMICYNERLLCDVKPVRIEIDGSFKHLGSVNSSVPHSQKPQNNFESNYDCIGAEIYGNATDEIYLKLPNGTILLMEYLK